MRITLLTQPACPLCDHAHEILVRVCAEHAIELRTLELTNAEGRALAGRAGVIFPPGVLVDDQLFSYGRLSERKLRRALDRMGRPATCDDTSH
ncbi:MAG: glutaredoxin family protein [Lysobacter sp.]|nr:glutaredoxin family protein [Lysobacter sp.]